MSGDKNLARQDEHVARMAQISLNIRKAVGNALPAQPEQFLTLAAPGKVVNFEVSRPRKSMMFPSQLISPSRNSPGVSTTMAN